MNWKLVATVAFGYAIVVFLGILFLEGLLGGCDVGKCLFLTVR
jgi:hypothetical protein